MFALIIAIIAIALTIYLAVSTLFYGGDALSNGSARAIASAFINQGQQINGVHTLFKNDNAGVKVGDEGFGLAALVDQEYLSSIPVPSKGSAWTVDAAFDTGTVTNLLVVKSTGVAEGAGSGNVGDSGYVAPTDASIIPDEVCDLINEQAGVGSETFGCVVGTTDVENTVWYRL
ncbi:hypothetical protein P5704_025790 (plasmid) [Pseudomonas sp. FeN3W]|nr:hypothetical protein P5704_025790 [Pseudomonas sp. FeN3W]